MGDARIVPGLTSGVGLVTRLTRRRRTRTFEKSGMPRIYAPK
jgi:hypothetical protein